MSVILDIILINVIIILVLGVAYLRHVLSEHRKALEDFTKHSDFVTKALAEQMLEDYDFILGRKNHG